MRNPYFAVVIACMSCWTLPLTAVLVVLFLLLSPVDIDRDRLGLWPLLPVVSCSGFLVFTLAGLTKHLLTTPASRLAPHFAKYHLTAVGFMAGVVWLLVSGVITAVTAADLFGIASVLLTLFVVLAWGACVRPGLLFWAMIGFFVLNDTPLAAVLTALVIGEFPAGSAALMAAGVAAVVMLGKRLAGLTEEDSAYAQPHMFAEDDSPQEHFQEEGLVCWARRRWNTYLAAPECRPVTGLWQECQRLRAALGASSPISLAIRLASGLLLVFLISRNMFSALLPSLGFLAAAVCVAGLCADWRRWPKTLGQKLLKPVSRRRLFLQVGLAMGSDLLKSGLVVAGVVILIWAVVAPDRMDLGVLMQIMVLAVCLVPVGVGLCGLLIRIRTDALFVLAALIVGLAGLSVATKVLDRPEILSAWPVTGAALLLAGTAACYVSYRLWMLADLD